MKARPMIPWAIAGGLAVALFSGMGKRETAPDATAAPVLQRLRALGELHTARFEYADVVDHRSYQEPDGMLAAIPGVNGIARAATENKALVNVRGSVEAGVDLRKMEAERTSSGLRITLPAPHAYRPDVDAKLFESKSGLLWARRLDRARRGGRGQDASCDRRPPPGDYSERPRAGADPGSRPCRVVWGQGFRSSVRRSVTEALVARRNGRTTRRASVHSARCRSRPSRIRLRSSP